MAFRTRAAQKARQAASGGDGPPAGRDPQVPGEPATPATADRGALRKRLRRTLRTRDAVLHELGALVMEMYRQRRHDPALVERKARDAIAIDTEARALAGALDRDEPLSSLQEAGIAGPCSSCGTLLARDDRFCHRCGAAAALGAAQAVQAPAPAAADSVAGDSPAPTAAERVEAPPPSSADLVSTDAPPPSSADRVDAPPPDAGARVEKDPPAGSDGDVPTYSVTTR